MGKLILDPALFEIPSNLPFDEQIDRLDLFEDNLNYIYQYTLLGVDAYNGAPYIGYYNPPDEYLAPPLTKENSTIRIRFNKLRKPLQRLIARGEQIETGKDYVDEHTMQFLENTITKYPFLQYLYQLLVCKKINSNQMLLVVAYNNYQLCPQIRMQYDGANFLINAIVCASTDTERIIGNFLCNETNPDKYFPHKAACAELNKSFMTKKCKGKLKPEEFKTLCRIYGTEAAIRNEYFQDPNISKKNHLHVVFRNMEGECYISIDEEHGGLELFKNNGNFAKHLGEYNFSCDFSKEAEPQNHKLIV